MRRETYVVGHNSRSFIFQAIKHTMSLTCSPGDSECLDIAGLFYRTSDPGPRIPSLPSRQRPSWWLKTFIDYC